MKNYTEFEKKQALKIANCYIFSFDNLYMNRKFKYDRRTRIGHFANQLINKKQITNEQKKEIINKRKLRIANKPQPKKNIFETPLIKDYLANKNNIKHIHENHLVFWGGRNHWAKTKLDHHFLSILLKKRNEKKQFQPL